MNYTYFKCIFKLHYYSNRIPVLKVIVQTIYIEFYVKEKYKFFFDTEFYIEIREYEFDTEFYIEIRVYRHRQETRDSIFLPKKHVPELLRIVNHLSEKGNTKSL